MAQSKKIDSREMGLQIGHLLGKTFLRTEHLHYGFWTDDLELNIENLRKAQECYTEFILANIPQDVKSILDVGCGCGENAKILLENGFDVDCISPSRFLTEMTRNRIGDVEIFECRFEEFQTSKKYDLILFSESFQYIKMDKALEKCLPLLNDNGYILICDFFKKATEGTSPMGGGHKLKKFFSIVNQFPLKKVSEIDITDKTAPNIDLVDKICGDVVIPLKNIVTEYLKSNFRYCSKILFCLIKLFFKRKIEKLEFKYLSRQRNAANFKKFKAYYLFVFQKSNDDELNQDNEAN